jgi:hypothetical protein
LFTERPKLSGASLISPSIFWAFVAVLIFVNTAHPQVVPYIKDIVGEDGMEKSDVDEKSDEERLRLIGTFKLFNPDTVPFYLWVIFENGGRFKHTRYGDNFPTVRLVDLELRYKNPQQQPMVKKFPNVGTEPRVKKRFGGSWLGGGRSGKRGARGRVIDEGGESDIDIEAKTYRGGRRSHGASEITFWKEDAQVYYEMELWGVLYAPDVREAVVAGRYVENINFEIELAK